MPTPGPSGAVQFVTPVDASQPQFAGADTGIRTRKHTPYTKTPRTRNLRKRGRGAVAATAGGGGRADDSVPDIAKEVVGKTWRIYQVSPLYRFSHQQLKYYPRLLAAFVQAELKKGFGIAVKDEETNTATLTAVEGLVQDEGECDAVRIQLAQKNKRGEELVVKLTALLCGVGVEQTSTEFTHLPVMLVKGPLTLARHLNAWMQVTFDCVVSPLDLSSSCLSWMLAMWCGSMPARGTPKRVELVYEVPMVKEITHTSLSIDFNQCHRLWNAIHEEGEDFTEKEVNDFVRSLEYHFYHHFKLSLEHLQLARIGTAIAYVGREGKIKIYSGSHLHQVLAHFTEYIQQHTLL